MKKSSVSVKDFMTFNLNSPRTIAHFLNRKGDAIITGKAELFEDGPIVSYSHNVSHCWFTIKYQEVVLHSQVVYTWEGILEAFRRANENFFLTEFSILSSEEISFSISEKLTQCKKYSTSKKVIKTNQRGQHSRGTHRRAVKFGNKFRFTGRPVPGFNPSKVELNEEGYYELPVYNSNSTSDTPLKKNSPVDIFLSEGMNLFLEAGGRIGAVSFNPNYLGVRVVHVHKQNSLEV
jgi:hypothetical protein